MCYSYAEFFFENPAKFPRGEFLGRTLHTERFSELSTSVLKVFLGRPNVKVKVAEVKGHHYLFAVLCFNQLEKCCLDKCCYRNVWKN